ncbi:hypothetical protein DV515_00012208 [Chloebia gouldiae]|uniref:Uncharacterized protein n=1 Tax=Chloebia gouldiae TaxID=44316 RepID=A0A3L8S4T8_CHLGU|nr:hypothetical protein DV515_00012208 [Chloebia gouldiae]
MLQFCFPGFEEEGVDCIEALDWLTSSNLYTAIISFISELEDVLSKQEMGTDNLLDVSFLLLCLKHVHSQLSGHSLTRAARNCFAKLMDNLSILMEIVQGEPCGCRAYLERDSLIQRLAHGLCRVNAQALEAGLYDRLPSKHSKQIYSPPSWKQNLSNATEELRSRDQVLYHQKRLLKDTEQDQQQLRETLEEAEPALKLGVK